MKHSIYHVSLATVKCFTCSILSSYDRHFSLAFLLLHMQTWQKTSLKCHICILSLTLNKTFPMPYILEKPSYSKASQHWLTWWHGNTLLTNQKFITNRHKNLWQLRSYINFVLNKDTQYSCQYINKWKEL